MLYLLLIITEFILMFLLSLKVQRALGLKLYGITKNKKATIYITALFFFPGTFLHEFAHFLMALFLLVPVGNMKLLPKIESDTVRLGSVSVAETDPVRRFLISIAPTITGFAAILVLVSFLPVGGLLINWKITLPVIYLIFAVSNTMFMSKKDSEGIWGFILISIFLIISLVLTGFDFSGVSDTLNNYGSLLEDTATVLIIPVLLDIMALALNRIK